VVVGSRSLLARAGLLASADDLAAASTVGVAVDGRLVAELSFEDQARPEARQAVAALRALGAEVALLSGDRAVSVERVAEAVGIPEMRGDLAPGEKAEVLRRWHASRSGVAMVGDGINDAPALAAADVGIAFGAASGLARQTADAIILREDLCEIPRLVALSRKTMRIVRQNLAWAFAYNSVGIVLAAFGLLRPVFASAAMVLSSLFVVGNSLRLKRSTENR
ncbi:MAG: HAD-IC family P-type ATPase, partial [Thermoanaerobaculia bacterium]